METFPSRLIALNDILSNSGSLPELKFHFAPLFGCICRLLGISLEMIERMYMRMLLRDIMSAATRLSVIGPLEGSFLQAEYAPFIEQLLTASLQGDGECNKVDEGDSDIVVLGQPIKFYRNEVPTQSAPFVDFLQSRHDTLYTRLFNS